jgi:hypothetical protein
MKYLALAFTLATLSGCSDISDYSDFKKFDEFAKLAVADRDCSIIANSTINKNDGGMIDADYTHDVLDYIRRKGNPFDECKEVSAKIDSYCDSKVPGFVENFTSSGTGSWGPNVKEKAICGQKIVDAFKAVNQKYQLPTANNKFIVFEDEGVMIDPNQVIKISFAESQLQLWNLALHTTESRYYLYFGDKDIWENAKNEISAIVSIN